MKDDLGNRMKEQYENRTRYFLPRRTYSIIRVDGKAFHTLTRGCAKPFDRTLMTAMQQTAVRLCREIQGARFAYTQSDEISILMCDFDKITTSAWFDGNLQKIVSISSAVATAEFNKNWDCLGQGKSALFDARVFTIPDAVEVENYFIWRQQDATRNSIEMAARALYSHKELHKKNGKVLQDMMHRKGVNWNDYQVDEKRGSCVVKTQELVDGAPRNRWVVDMPPVFTQDRNYLRSRIPGFPVATTAGLPVEVKPSLYEVGDVS